MRRKSNSWLLLTLAAFALTAVLYVGSVWATASTGFTATTLAKGTLGHFEVFNHAVLPAPPASSDGDGDDKSVWLSLQKTKGASDLYVQSNLWQPVNPLTGAVSSTGWHSHPGHSLITVTQGTVTDYESDDSQCKPQVYTAGMSFVDGGGKHAHIIRNEGTVAAATIAVQLVPAGAARRVEADAPPNCPANIK
jgi:hypothetical protein